MSLGEQNSPWLRTSELIYGDRVGIMGMLGARGVWGAIDWEEVQ